MIINQLGLPLLIHSFWSSRSVSSLPEVQTHRPTVKTSGVLLQILVQALNYCLSIVPQRRKARIERRGNSPPKISIFPMQWRG